MSRRWLIQSNSDEQPPLTFRQLAERLADGTLRDDDLVRAEGQADWQPTDSVIGLHRAALQILRSRGSDSSHGGSLAAQTTPGEPPVPDLVEGSGPAASDSPTLNGDSGVLHRDLRLREASRLTWIIVAAAVIVVSGVAWAICSHLYEQYRFPRPAHAAAPGSAWWVPGLGNVSEWEFAFLCFDVVAVVYLVRHWRRSAKQRRRVNPQS